MSMMIKDALGKRLSPQEVADVVGRGVSSVYKNYSRYGGVKDGNKLLFFEKWVFDALKKMSLVAHESDLDNDCDEPGGETSAEVRSQSKEEEQKILTQAISQQPPENRHSSFQVPTSGSVQVPRIQT